MTREEAADAISQSLELVAERAGDPSPRVFARLFERLPEVEARFSTDPRGTVRGEMLAMVFDCLMSPGGPYQMNLVRTERVNHEGFGTPANEFDQFFGIVKDTCAEILADDWTPEFDAAWNQQIAWVMTGAR